MIVGQRFPHDRITAHDDFARSIPETWERTNGRATEAAAQTAWKYAWASRLPRPRLSASIGVKRRALVSLTSVKATVGSARNSFSRLIAAVHPCETAAENDDVRFLLPGFFVRVRSALRQNKRSAKCTATVAKQAEAQKPKSSQPTSAGKKRAHFLRRSIAAFCPAKSGSKITLIAPPQRQAKRGGPSLRDRQPLRPRADWVR